ncbi:AraC family transcriptional regulator [Mucilaginibacter sp. HMF5004]|uniref:helix-turn-helix domain-containing protein n=1 Tax=Mucilaginibacter rivuli TaxID=2857527 RepID=UPI001C5E5926|nr:AraC family transcriptional regulator [Mucilaginibacter rivuli]MBW4891576.1 AraC family transcriptional regulator [Mucilaginibacter rivuli]
MVNLYSTIKESNLYRKIEVNELLFVEYTCSKKVSQFGIWSDNNYFAFISSGKKIWRSIYNSYEVADGDIIFVKKGANLTHAFFDDEFCATFVFIPDDFIRTFLKRNVNLLEGPVSDVATQDAVLRVQPDELLKNYCQSVHSFLSMSEEPNKQLLSLKFDELLLSLFANERHKHLTDYFVSLCRNPHDHMSRIMEANFAYNLKLEELAQLCNMSLSAFKNAFKQQYNTTPALWLKNKKLDLALSHIITSDMTVSQVAFECGFEDPSHFIRVFKEKYDLTPLQYRQNHTQLAYAF